MPSQKKITDFIVSLQPSESSSVVQLASPAENCGQCPAFHIRDGWLFHPLLNEKQIGYREYQLNITRKAINNSTLVVLPTALGKTVIAALVAAEVIHHHGGKVVFVAPTKPLAYQHLQSFQKLFRTDIQANKRMALFTGSTSAKKREQLWKKSGFIFATPQGIENDLAKGRYTLSEVVKLVFDEAHRAVGDYSYVAISKLYQTQSTAPLVLGLTASPGSKTEKIDDVLSALNIKHIETREPEDSDVNFYVKPIDIVWSKVRLTPAMARLRDAMENSLLSRINQLKRTGFLRHRRRGQKISKKEIIQVGQQIQARFATQRGRGKGLLFGAMFNQAAALQLCHCLELLETQGIVPLKVYLERMMQKEQQGEKLSRTEKSFIKDEAVTRALEACENHTGSSHPKEDALLDTVKDQLSANPNSLIIVFAQFRDTISCIIQRFNSEGLDPVRFVGQAHRKGDAGISQKEQAEILDRFRKREFNILVASSVVEEGLDIPAVDLVVFYEPVPSEIRTIQRRGRTGRSEVGKVTVLITEDSRDEAFLNAEIAREKKMKKLVRRMGQKTNNAKT